MRNLKRALSLTLAAVMLLGMMITGAGAASTSFTDSDQIVNQEAAAVTSGLKIFEGYTDGSFGPERPVTRAEMAVIICKLLNGADVDPTNFTGISKFTDVPGWAEGYVNYCNSMGIVVGVGDGKFDPNRTVSTVEAATMLLKALGYFVEEDQLKEDWKTVVTGRATSLKLYGDLTLSVDEPLTRDNVAELVFHTLFAQRVAYDDNRHLYVKNTNRDVVVTNGTNDYLNTLAENTFGMWVVDGTVTANSFTEDRLSETVNNAPRTEVLFDEAAAQDYPATAYRGGTDANYPFEYTTGLDMIGHAARVYYKIERNAPVVYAIVDMATKVEYISYDKDANNTRLANAANEAGFRRNTILDIPENEWKVNYSWTSTIGTLNTSASLDEKEVVLSNMAVNGRHEKWTVSVPKTLIVISNSSDYAVDQVIVLDQYLDTVRRVVDNANGGKEYDLTTVDGLDQNIAHSEFAQGDYAIVTDVGNLGRMFNLEAPEKVTASISQITGRSDDKATVTSIIADGTTYTGSPVAHHEDAKQGLERSTQTLDNTTNFESIAKVGETTLLLDFQGYCIGIAEPESVTNYAYVSQFGIVHTLGSLNTEYTLTARLHFVDGTSGVYNVSLSGSISGNTFGGLKMGSNEPVAKEIAKLLNNGWDGVNNVASGVYDPRDTYPTTLDVDTTKTGPAQLSGTLTGEHTTGLGVYRVSVRSDNTVVLYSLGHEQHIDHTKAQGNVPDGVRLVAGHSTLVRADGNNLLRSDTCGVTGAAGEAMYQTDKTVYFYVDGCRTDGTGGANPDDYTFAYDNDDLVVSARTGVANAYGFTNTGASAARRDKDDNKTADSIEQLFVSEGSAAANGRYHRDTVTAMMVYGIDLGVGDTRYFFGHDSYHFILPNGTVVSRADEQKVAIVYDLYTLSGEKYSKTYDNNGKYYDIEVAREKVGDHETGFYTLGRDDIEEIGSDARGYAADQAENGDYLWTDSEKSTPGNPDRADAKNIYVIRAQTHTDDAYSNIFTDIDPVAGLTSSTIIVDTTGNGLDTVTAIARRCAAGDIVRISYTYKTDDFKIGAIFVTDYIPKELAGNQPGKTLGFVRASGNGSGLTIGWHATDFPQSDTAAIIAAIESIAGGMKVREFNTFTRKVTFDDAVGIFATQVDFTWQEYKFVQYGSTKLYVQDGGTATFKNGDLGLTADADYLLNEDLGAKPADVLEAASDSTTDNSIGSVTEDVVLKQAFKVDAAAGITAKLTSDNTQVLGTGGSGDCYVAKGVSITAVPTTPDANGTQTLTVYKGGKGDAPADGDALKAGAGTVEYTVDQAIDVRMVAGYSLTVTGNAIAQYTDADGNTVNVTSAAPAVGLTGTETAKLVGATANRYWKVTQGDTITFETTSDITSTGVTVDKNTTIDGTPYVKVTTTTPTDAAKLAGVETAVTSGTPDTTAYYAPAAMKVDKKVATDPASKIFSYSAGGTTATAVPYGADGKTYAEIDAGDDAADGNAKITAIAPDTIKVTVKTSATDTTGTEITLLDAGSKKSTLGALFGVLPSITTKGTYAVIGSTLNATSMKAFSETASDQIADGDVIHIGFFKVTVPNAVAQGSAAVITSSNGKYSSKHTASAADAYLGTPAATTDCYIRAAGTLTIEYALETGGTAIDAGNQDTIAATATTANKITLTPASVNFVNGDATDGSVKHSIVISGVQADNTITVTGSYGTIPTTP